jgi:hypothetical protein
VYFFFVEVVVQGSQHPSVLGLLQGAGFGSVGVVEVVPPTISSVDGIGAMISFAASLSRLSCSSVFGSTVLVIMPL